MEHHVMGDAYMQTKMMLQGFWSILPQDDLQAAGLTHRELALLIAGCSVMDIADWKQHAVFPDHNVARWLWEILEEMPDKDRAKLLHFTTGSSRLPTLGFAGLSPKFTVRVDGEGDDVPHAHTCANLLIIPAYPSKDVLVDKMNIALANDVGFGMH